MKKTLIAAMLGILVLSGCAMTPDGHRGIGPVHLMNITDLEDFKIDCSQFDTQYSLLTRMIHEYNENRVVATVTWPFAYDVVTAKAIKSRYYGDELRSTYRRLLDSCGMNNEEGRVHRQLLAAHIKYTKWLNSPKGLNRTAEEHKEFDAIVNEIHELGIIAKKLNEESQDRFTKNKALDSRLCREQGLKPGCTVGVTDENLR